MAKSKESFSKKDKEQKRQKNKKAKQEKMEERKLNAKKGRSLEDMMAYVDENGNITDTPPDPVKRKTINAEDIEIGIPSSGKKEQGHSGTVQYYDDTKGFGFIFDEGKKERIFFHHSNTLEKVSLSDRVEYELRPGERGWVAIDVKKKQSA